MSGSGGTIVTIDKKNNKVRTRYAPSPTGYFHIGGARTAIFNYLFAKHNNGDFIVRIEDTDITRSVDNGIESQINNLNWLGVKIDESLENPNEKYGAYVQTQKLSRYQELAYKLLDEGKAYRCFCDEEQLERDRQEKSNNHETPKYSRRCYKLTKEEIDEKLKNNIPYVIRLKIDENKNYQWDDLIRGQISVPGDAMTDPVILKSNKIPMYNFAVVVDDYDMEISHVLRGEEHISNTPYQLAIKNALNFKSSIQYGHLSIIVDETGKKLSKRNQTTKQFIEDYKNMGFLPEAVFNFLSLLSWSSETNQEILSPNELISLFDIERLSKSPTFFDYKKMLWIGNEYFKKMNDLEYLSFIKPFVKFKLNDFLKDNFDTLALLFKNQISYADELNSLFSEFFTDSSAELNDEMRQIILENKNVVECFKNKIKNIEKWNIENISKIIEEVKQETNKKGKNLFMPIRIACTNLMHGPELAKIIFLKQLKPILFNIDKINLS
ncbi:MAG: glutamate--tRNA ligase [Ureaplasma sp.]|nr:glutamate--tRNA ligase [Ureaplasma sp.]MDE7221809.1 glutamate--tRNA ligase [Ureaplasma sp.]